MEIGCVATKRCAKQCVASHVAVNKDMEMPIVFKLLGQKMQHPQFAMGVHGGYFKTADPARLECAAYREGAIAGMELWERVMALTELERGLLLHQLKSMPHGFWEKPHKVRFEKLTAVSPLAVAALTSSWAASAFSADFVVRMGINVV